MPSVLCKSIDELSRTEVHNNGTGSPSSGLCVQEVLTLPTWISNCLPYESQLIEVSG